MLYLVTCIIVPGKYARHDTNTWLKIIWCIHVIKYTYMIHIEFHVPVHTLCMIHGVINFCTIHGYVLICIYMYTRYTYMVHSSRHVSTLYMIHRVDHLPCIYTLHIHGPKEDGVANPDRQSTLQHINPSSVTN